ncbi:MAG: hypothetical protein ACRCU5_15735 [Rhizobiaceae bacterium]
MTKNTQPLMRIDGKMYKESKPVKNIRSVCGQCAFSRDTLRCVEAIDEASKPVFGGDCVDRDVIYEEVKDA